MVPYLRPEELEAVWKKLESGPCARFLSPAEKNWIALFKAMGRRDAVAMVNGARVLLENVQRIDPEPSGFLVASGMVGYLMHGNREGSLRLWNAYRSYLFGTRHPDLFFRLLSAESMPSN